MSSGSPRSLCVLFADISGSTRLYEQSGNAVALRAIDTCLNAASDVVKMHQGRVVKTIGDEIMVVFDSVENAAHAACEIQRRIENLPAIAGYSLKMHIGFQAGEAIESGNDVFGDAVNVAARLTELAKPGQILTTSATFNAPTSPNDMLVVTALRSAFVKGKTEQLALMEVHWQNRFAATHVVNTMEMPGASKRVLHLQAGDKEYCISAELPVLMVGRDPSSHIVVPQTQASRLHAWLEMRGDSFVLIDQSSNGTYVTFAGKPEFKVLRQELQLRSSGTMCFGSPAERAPENLLNFTIQEG